MSKQKSCVACASSKLGCDLGTPSCSRCIHRNKRCQYVSLLAADTLAQQKRPEDQPSAQKKNTQRTSQQQSQQQGQQLGLPSDESHGQFLYLGSEAHSSLEENLGPRGTRSADTSSKLDAMIATGSARGGASTTIMALSTPSPRDQHHPPGSASNLTLGSWHMESPPNTRQGMSDSLPGGSLRDTGMSPDWLKQNIYAFGTTGSDSGESASRWQHSRLLPSRSPFMSSEASLPAEMEYVSGNAMSGISNDDLNFDLLGSLGILTQNHVSSTPNAQQSPLSAMLRPLTSAGSSGPNIAPPIRNVTTRDQSPQTTEEVVTTKGTLYDAVKMATGAASVSGAVPGGNFDEQGWQRCPFHKLNTADELVRIICNYPRIMVRPGEYPPFVHHKLYRCATGEVSEPLARAFCCVGAFYASVPTSETFVYTMINEESSKLVKIFVSSARRCLLSCNSGSLNNY